MKQWAVWAVLVAGTLRGWGEPQRFPISLMATVETETKQMKISDQNLVTAPGNRLVLMVDLAAHVIAIEEWNTALSARIDRDAVLSGTQAMLENYRMAQVAGKKLMANLEMVDMDWNNDGELDHDGNLQMDAKLKVDRKTGLVSGLSATLLGVLNDPVNSGNGGENMLFKGRVRTTGPAF